MRATAWLPGGGFLLLLLLAGLVLLAADLGGPLDPSPAAAPGGGWMRLVNAEGEARFVRTLPGEPLPDLLAREDPGLSAGIGHGCAGMLTAPGVEVLIHPGREEPGEAGTFSCRLALLPEGVRYLMGMRMNVNRAGPGELAMLPGIGSVMAGRIVEERDRRNGFSRTEELLRVPGIGPKRLERMAGHVTVDP